MVDLQNRTQYDRWHHAKSVEMDKCESQYIKKPEKILIWRCLRQNRAVCNIMKRVTKMKKLVYQSSRLYYWCFKMLAKLSSKLIEKQ